MLLFLFSSPFIQMAPLKKENEGKKTQNGSQVNELSIYLVWKSREI